jgi:hypothetical protein
MKPSPTDTFKRRRWTDRVVHQTPASELSHVRAMMALRDWYLRMKVEEADALRNYFIVRYDAEADTRRKQSG